MFVCYLFEDPCNPPQDLNCDTEVWDSDADESSDDDIMDFTEDHTVRESTQYHHRYSRILSIFCLSWQYRFHLPDTVVSALLMFISAFLTVLNVMVKSDLISAVIRILPTTVNKCRSLLGVKENFQTYVCCKKCNTLYQLDKCLDKINGKLVSKRCIHIDFPNHPMPSFRRKKM